MMIFQDKYAPTCFGDLIFPDAKTSQRLHDFAKNRRHDSIIFHGPYGTAKSTTAKILIRARTEGLEYGGIDFHRATKVDFRTLDSIRNQWALERFCGVIHPTTIIDEADKMPPDVQYAFRWLIDMNAKDGSFIFTTNNLHNVDPGLVDRCDVIELPAANTEHWFERARWILDQEGVEMSDLKLKALLATCDGSIRDLMRALQDAVLNYYRDAA